jgi:UDP-N-acetylmuramoyl-tripeptide--D-alanyl-D-alanine ligase
MEPGQVFFALKGCNFDGNAYAAQALAGGAAAAVVDDPVLANQAGMYWVPDVLTALQDLAHAVRLQAKVPVLAITGSNGKTTTKALIAEVLSGWQPALVTPGNFNNHIGLPLTVLQWQPQHTFMVLEMGDNHPGEIAALCRIAAPTAGLITNVGLDHLEGYGTFEANVATKCELFDYLQAQHGTLLVNVADPHLAAYARHLGALTYGPGGRWQVQQVIPNGTQGTKLTVLDTHTQAALALETVLLGHHNVENVLACVVACTYLGVPAAAIQEGISRYRPTQNRSQLLHWEGRTLLLDAYNANPSSMEAAIRTIFEMANGAVLLVLGDMLELGSYAAQAHTELGQYIAAQSAASGKPYFALLVGPEMAAAAATLPADCRAWVPDTAAAQPVFEALLAHHGFVLLKGSRGIALERLLASHMLEDSKQ